MKPVALLIVFIGAMFASAVHAQTVPEAIPLKYRSADQVIPLVRPFLDKEGAISGLNNQLIIRTSPANLQQIKDILRKIDTLPRKLMITVRQAGQREAEEKGAEASGSAGAGGARATVEPKGEQAGGSVEYRRGEDAARARVYGTRAIEKAEDIQRVQVLEGNPAFIRIGTAVPVPERTVVQGGRTVTVIEGTSYKDVTAGFYVLPRVSGDTVTLEISPQRNTVGEAGRINLQQAQITVSGRLGEWLEIGGSGRDGSSEGSGVVYSTAGMGAERRTILLRVEEVK